MAKTFFKKCFVYAVVKIHKKVTNIEDFPSFINSNILPMTQNILDKDKILNIKQIKIYKICFNVNIKNIKRMKK